MDIESICKNVYREMAGKKLITLTKFVKDNPEASRMDFNSAYPELAFNSNSAWNAYIKMAMDAIQHNEQLVPGHKSEYAASKDANRKEYHVVQAEKPVEDAKVNAPTAEEKPIEEPVKEEVPADDEAALEKEFVEEPAVKDETKAEDEEEPKVEANPEDDLLAASGEQNEDEDELLKKYNVTKEDLDKLDTNADFDEDEHSEDDALDDDTESLSDEDEDDGLDSYEQYEKEWD